MKKELIYPLILEVKVKKECLKRIIFILDKDSIKFLDKNYPKVLLFQTPIEDCEVFLRKSDDILKQEIYLISRSNSFTETIIKHKYCSVLKIVKEAIEKTINLKRPSLTNIDIINKVVRTSSVDSSYLTDNKELSDSIEKEEIKILDEGNISKRRVLQIMSLPYENFKLNSVKIKSSNIHYLNDKLIKSERAQVLKSVSDLSIYKDLLLAKFTEYRNYIMISISFLFIILFLENFIIVLLIAPILIYSEKSKVVNSFSNLIPSIIKNFISNNRESINPKVSFNSNYFLKSSIIVKKNLITVFNYISELENEVYWKKYMVEMNESNSKFSYTLKMKNDTFISEQFVRNTTIFNRSIIITDYNEKELLNIILLDSIKHNNYTKITTYTLLNNSFNIVYFKSVKSALKNFVSFMNFKQEESYYESNNPCILIEKKLKSYKRDSEI